jgi:hypothetical protein
VRKWGKAGQTGHFGQLVTKRRGLTKGFKEEGKAGFFLSITKTKPSGKANFQLAKILRVAFVKKKVEGTKNRTDASSTEKIGQPRVASKVKRKRTAKKGKRG